MAPVQWWKWTDEAKFGKRKYNRGRWREGHCRVLGGVERGTDNVFMEVVPTRDAATLLPIILKHVLPGAEIHTDEWRPYARLQRRGFQHHTVNHSVNVVDPTTGAHTQTIESTSELFPTYQVEFSWRRQYGKDTPFAMFLNCISSVYHL